MLTTLLLIEDNPADVRYLKELVGASSDNGFDLLVAGSLAEGIEKLAGMACDLALLDLGLPDSKGMETLTRFLEKAGNVPVVIMTGLDDEMVGMEAVSRGAQDYLVKGKVGGPILHRVVRYAIERKRNEERAIEAEKKIRKSEEFTRNILDIVDEGFIVIDRDFRILNANKAFCVQVGATCDDIIGRTCYDVSHKTARPCHMNGEDCAARHVFETASPYTSLHHHKDAQGMIMYVETKGFPILDASGAVTSMIEIINNMTERHLLEQERLKSQKLESIGTLAGGIAHDFNNLLQGIFGYISLAKMSLDRPERAKTMLAQAEEALHLSVNLTTQLLTFAKGGKPVKKTIRLPQVIENSVKFALSGSATDNLLEIPVDLWAVEADEGQISQVIQNIVLNANEAMAGHGAVKVTAENIDLPRGKLQGLPDGGRFVRLDITDSGIGIPEQNLGKIFDPYFTTKQKGSGLGLATSYSIIKNHAGFIDVKSALNKGSTFSLYLPAAATVEAEIETAVPAAAARRGRILFMDDEELLRDVAREAIGDMGHELECAEDGGEAVEMFRQARESGRPYDLVILDLTVKGGMGGEEAIRKIMEIDPEVVAVVSSGYADNPVVADYRAHGFTAFLNKPYKISALKDCLNALI